MKNEDVIKALNVLLKHYKQNPDTPIRYYRVGNVAIKVAEIEELKLT